MGDPDADAQQAPDEEPTDTTGQQDPNEPTPDDPDTGDTSGDGDAGIIYPG